MDKYIPYVIGVAAVLVLFAIYKTVPGAGKSAVASRKSEYGGYYDDANNWVTGDAVEGIREISPGTLIGPG